MLDVVCTVTFDDGYKHEWPERYEDDKAVRAEVERILANGMYCFVYHTTFVEHYRHYPGHRVWQIDVYQEPVSEDE